MNKIEWAKYNDFFNYWGEDNLKRVCTPMLFGFKEDLEKLLRKINYILDCRD